MTKKIKIKRGLEAALPPLQEGEPGFTLIQKNYLLVVMLETLKLWVEVETLKLRH